MTKTILLADDSVTIQKVVELTFMDEPYQVMAVSDGQAALDKLSEMRPDLVIADVHMPEANGYEVCRQTKQTYPGMPVLLLVGTFEPFDQQQATDVGADSHLKKPFDSQDLLQKVATLIEQSAPASPAPASPEPMEIEDIPPAMPAAVAPEAPASVGFEMPSATIEPPGIEPIPATAPAVETPAFALPTAETPAFALPTAETPAFAPPVAEAPAFEAPAFAAQVEAEAPVEEASAFTAPDVSAPVVSSEFALPEPAPVMPEPAPVMPEPVMPEPEPVMPEPEFVMPEPESVMPESVMPEPAPVMPESVMPEPAPVMPESVMPEPAPVMPEPVSVDPESIAPESSLPQAGSSFEPVPEEVIPIAYEPEAEVTPVVFEPEAVVASEPQVSAEAVEAEPVKEETSPAASNGSLSEDDVDRIARRVADLLGDTVLRQVAWEVLPDLAEVVIKERIKELESQVE